MNLLKKTLSICLLLNYHIQASDSNHSLQSIPLDEQQVDASNIESPSHQYTTVEGSICFNDCASKLSDSCKLKWVQGAAAFTVCAALGLGFGFGYAPYTYRVYNRDSDSIYLHYRPGCTQKSGDMTHAVDCVKHIYPGNHAVIYSLGHLTKLCARDDWDNYWSQNCATYNGVQNDVTWNVHNHHGELYFGRGQYPSSEETNINSSDVTFGFYNSSDVTSEFTKVNFSGSMQK